MNRAESGGDDMRFPPRGLAGGVNYNFRRRWSDSDLAVTGAAGAYVYLSDGRALIDLLCAYGARAFPHGCGEYIDAVLEGARISTGCLPSVAAQRLLELLLPLFPHHEQARLCVTGTEAVQLALRLSRAATKRTRVLRFENHYHGHLDALLGGMYSESSTHLPDIPNDDYRASEGVPFKQWQDLNLILPPGDIELVQRVFDSLGEDIAAVILEPCPINSGGGVMEREFLIALKMLCHDHGAILIFDEIITGFRAGLGGYQSTLKVKADITVLGKALGGGSVPVAAVLGPERLLKLCSEHRVVHGGTFNGNLTSVHAAIGTVTLLSGEGDLSLKSLVSSGASLMSAIIKGVDIRGLPVIVKGIPGAIWLHPAPTSEIADRWLPYDLLQTSLIESGLLPVPPSRLYVSAGMTHQEIERSTSLILDGLERFSDAYSKLSN